MMKKILHNPQALIGLALIALVTAVALLAPVLAPHAPDAVNLALKYQPASSEFPLGTDQLGRCELSRLLYGARASLGLALPILVLLGAVGLGLGLAAAAVGGWLERGIVALSQIFLAFPSLIIACAIIGVLGGGLENTVLAVVLSMWARFTQLVRTYAKTELAKGYILAARVSGCSTWRLMTWHPAAEYSAAVSRLFLKRCVVGDPYDSRAFPFSDWDFSSGTAEWGAMLSEAQAALYSHPVLLIYPGL